MCVGVCYACICNLLVASLVSICGRHHQPDMNYEIYIYYLLPLLDVHTIYHFIICNNLLLFIHSYSFAHSFIHSVCVYDCVHILLLCCQSFDRSKRPEQMCGPGSAINFHSCAAGIIVNGSS